MKTMEKMIREIAEQNVSWRYYVENDKIVGANQEMDLYCATGTLEETITKIWLHYYGNKEYQLTEKYFTPVVEV